MAMFKGENPQGRQGDTVIGAGVKVEGNFAGEGNVIVEGQLQGSLKTKHNATIGKDAIVRANVEAQDVFLAGALHGNVKATGKLIVAASGKISGNVEATVLSIEEGASLNGKVTMGSTEKT